MPPWVGAAEQSAAATITSMFEIRRRDFIRRLPDYVELGAPVLDEVDLRRAPALVHHSFDHNELLAVARDVED